MNSGRGVGTLECEKKPTPTGRAPPPACPSVHSALGWPGELLPSPLPPLPFLRTLLCPCDPRAQWAGRACYRCGAPRALQARANVARGAGLVARCQLHVIFRPGLGITRSHWPRSWFLLDQGPALEEALQ